MGTAARGRQEEFREKICLEHDEEGRGPVSQWKRNVLMKPVPGGPDPRQEKEGGEDAAVVVPVV